MQFKQGIIGETATLVPDFIVWDLSFSPPSSAVATTISLSIWPQISCPNITGGVTFWWPFLYTLTSYPHTAQAFTLSRTPLLPFAPPFSYSLASLLTIILPGP